MKLKQFINVHGWFFLDYFHDYLAANGIAMKFLERHNQTDGAVHAELRHVKSGKKFTVNANYWDAESFDAAVNWANKMIKK